MDGVHLYDNTKSVVLKRALSSESTFNPMYLIRPASGIRPAYAVPA